MEVSKEETLNTLQERGYNTEWAENIPVTIKDTSAPSHEALDNREVRGQLYDGLFENDPQVDFTELTKLKPLLGRMMFYMISLYGTDYTYNDLVDDLELLAEEYEVEFDRKEALEQKQ